MRNSTAVFMVTLILVATLIMAFDIRPVRASGTIYIRADGSIDPPTAPISTADNITYTFTDSINDSIVVERSNIVIEGNGYTLQGSGSGNGFEWSGINNVTIKNTNIENFDYGIQLDSSSDHNSVSGNTIANNTVGIWIDYTAENNTVSGNNILFNEVGLRLEGANNSLSQNTLAANFIGLSVPGRDNTLTDNQMNNNTFNFECADLHAWVFASVPANDIDVSNKINGRSVYYLQNQTDLLINPSTHPDIGFLALKGCRNVTVEGLRLEDNGAGVLLEDCVDCAIENCEFRDNMAGVFALNMSHSSIMNTTITGNLRGITMFTGGFNLVIDNSIVNNTVNHLPYRYPDNWRVFDMSFLREWKDTLLWYSAGIHLLFLDNSTLNDNRIVDNDHGILISQSSFSTLRNNSVHDNAWNFGLDDLGRFYPPEWNFGPPDPPAVSRYLAHEIDASNTVDGRPIYYWVGKHGRTVPVDAGYVALIGCSDMLVKNLVLSSNYQGIFMVWVNNTLVLNNTISNTRYGIYVSDQFFKGYNNTIDGNDLTMNGVGVYTARTANCTIHHNSLSSNLFGIVPGDADVVTDNIAVNHTKPSLDRWILGYFPPNANVVWWRAWQTSEAHPDGVAGIFIQRNNSTVAGNLLSNNSIGLILGSYNMRGGHFNRINGNTFKENTCGITLWGGNNTIIHNNFLENAYSAYVYPWAAGKIPADGVLNVWDNGVEGNYWDSYTGADTNADGIGDTDYVATAVPGFMANIDHYPLMGMFTDFEVTPAFHVQAICNSTISEFQFNGTALSFNATGEDDTTGFCRICIPTALMNDTFRVFVNGTEITPPPEPLPCSTSTHTYLYFTYLHSTKAIVIIPEWPSLSILPLLMIATLLAIIVYSRGHSFRAGEKRAHTTSTRACASSLQRGTMARAGGSSK